MRVKVIKSIFLLILCFMIWLSGCGDSGGSSDNGDNSNASEGPFIIVDLTDSTVTEQDTISDLETNDAYKITKIVLKKISSSTYDMGDETGDGYSDELPVHTVTVSQPFYMGVFEVTQRQWYEVMGTWPSYFTTDPDKRPMEQVSWNVCRDFITELNTIISGGGYRLPTEAEWEYACKAGTHTNYSCGDTADGAYMWSASNSGDETHEVGTKLANPWGLFDMHGNVFEWCEDDFHGDYTGAPADGSAWIDDPRGSQRVVRGGSWFFFAPGLRSAYRYSGDPSVTYDHIGFRISRAF